MSESLTKSPPTREQILCAAEAAVLSKGFNGTSIDELITAVGISKSGFFYHFRDKTELAKALLERYIANEDAIFDDIFARADELSEDPLHSFLIALKLMADLFSDLPNGHPGCLVALACYHEQLFDREVRAIIERAVVSWRERFSVCLERVVQRYPARVPVDVNDLAAMLSVVVDGGIVMSKSLKDPGALPRQVLQYRDFIRLVFDPTLVRADVSQGVA